MPQCLGQEYFASARINSVTFTIDRLPFLKNLLAAYEEEEEKQRKRHEHDFELSQLLKPFAMEFGFHFQDIYEKRSIGDLRFYPIDEKSLRIISGYAGHLLKGLEELRSKGWDGESGMLFDSYAESYRRDAIFQLRSFVNALEAGNKEATLNIPKELASQYEAWFIGSITYALHKDKGAAA